MYHDFSAKFSNKLLRQLVGSAKDDGNIAISPSRLQNVLVLLANWATPKTRKVILDCVGSEVMDLEEANILCNKELLHIIPIEERYEDRIPNIEINTFLWLKEGIEVKTDGLTSVSDNFDVVLRRVDFSLPETKSIINKVVEEASRGLIKEINSEFTPTTRMLLTDILYFKASWEGGFSEEDTKERIFYGINGEEKIPMMRQTDYLKYREAQSCQIVQLRYMCIFTDSHSFTMRIYLPKKGNTILDVLYEIWNDGFNLALEEERVKLTLPKFTIESNVYMKDILLEMGLESILQNTDIVPGLVDDMQIDDIFQKVKIKIDEKGTEVAALTEMCLVMGGYPDEIIAEPIVMNVNHPFMFEITEEHSNTIMFSGIINNLGTNT